MTKKRTWSLVCLFGVAFQLVAAEGPATPGATPDGTASMAPRSVGADELKKLRERIAQQEDAIKKLQQSVDEQRTMLNDLQTTLSAAPMVANTSASTGDGPVRLVPVAASLSQPSRGLFGRAQKSDVQEPALGIKIGNSTFTPLGFVDFTFVARSTNVGTGIATGFGGIPYNNSVTGRISENNLSTANSRLGFRVDSTFMGAKVLGYVEADFFGNQPGGVYVTSNANTFRMRNLFVDVQKNGLEVLGGQDWSLFTPNRKGLSPLPSDIFYTQNIDLNYQAGLVWARQSQFRLIAHPNADLAFGISIENPQQYTNTFVTFPAAFGTGITGELNNNANNYATPNLHPDIIFKAAYDGHAGDRVLHVEAGALIRSFKDVLPSGQVAPAASYRSSSVTAASGEVNANLEIVKNFKIIANTFFGSGNGRYVGTGLGPDVIVRADGSLSPVHSYSTVDGFEFTRKNTVLSALYGGAYFGRDVAIDANNKLIGYGFTGSNNNRSIQEGTFDIVQTLWKNRNYGDLKLIGQYSYLWRDPWSYGIAGAAPARNARTNMYFIDLRYDLP